MKALLLLVTTLISVEASAQRSNPLSSNGEEAIRLHNKQLDRIAAKNNMSRKNLENQLRKDKAFRLDQQGDLFVQEAYIPDLLGHTESVLNPMATQIPESSTYQLHSRPGAAKNIVLDFTGHEIVGSAWNSYSNGNPINALPFNISGRDSNVMDSDEKAIIRDIWLKVSEDYAPFDVNITTDESLAVNGSRVVITPSDEWFCAGCAGGVAYVGTFGNNFYAPAWVFSHNLANNAKYVAEAISHEVGHNLGLSHSASYTSNGTKTADYNTGIGSGDTGWAPIMGAGYYRKNTTWHNGPTSVSISSIQDDFAIITGKISFIADDAPDSISNSSFRKLVGLIDVSGQQFKHSGNIVVRSDVDVLRIYAGNGPLNLQIATSNPSTNLDFKIRLVSSSGAVLSEQNPAGSANVSIALAAVDEDIYSLEISTSAFDTNSISDQIQNTNYGSRGRYYINGTAAAYTGTIPDDTFVGGSSGGGGGGQPTNQAPVVSAGADKSLAYLSTSVLLQGTASDDGSIASIAWSQVSGPSQATLINANTLALTASNLLSGQYVFRLTAVDNYGLSSSDTVTVTISGAPVAQAPSVSAGADKSITLPVNSIAIQGSATDSDGTIISIAWTQISGPSSATLSGQSSLSLSASNLIQGSYVFRLTAVDSQGLSSTDDVTVKVNRKKGRR